MAELNISDKNHRPFLYGIWETEMMVKNNDTLLPLITDSQRWRYLIIERKGRALVKTMTDDFKRYRITTDTTNLTLSVVDPEKEKDTFLLKFSKLKNNQLTLEGRLVNDDYLIELRKKPVDSFTLIKTGFNWINERPNNQ